MALTKVKGAVIDGLTPKTLYDYGCVGDGVTDDETNFAAAIAGQTGDVLHVTPGTYLISGTHALASNSHVVIWPGAVIRQVTTGDISIFSLAAGTSGQSITGSGRLEGPYHSTTPAPTGTYPAGNGAIRMTGLYNSLIEDVVIEGVEIKGWGDYGIFAEDVTNLSISNCFIQDCGRDGIRTYGANYCKVDNCHIDNISPGLSGTPPNLNAYGVTFTRNPEAGETTTTRPRTRNSSVTNCTIRRCDTWKCLDTHGGQNILFANNICTDAYIGIGVDEGDTTGSPGNAPALNVTIHGNHIIKGDGETGGSAITVASDSFSTPAEDIKIEDNNISGEWGESGGGALNMNFITGGSITGNAIDDAAFSGIIFPTKSFAVQVGDNVIKNLTGTPVAAITSDDAESVINIESGVFVRTTGTYTGIKIGSPTAGFGVTVGAECHFVGSMSKFEASSEARIEGGSWLERPVAWARITSTGSLSGSHGVASSAKNSTGDYTITLEDAMIGTSSMIPVVTVRSTSTAYRVVSVPITTTTIDVNTFNASDVAADAEFSIAVFGY